MNVEGTRTLLEVAAEAGVKRFVHTSTAGTCGPVAGRPATEADEPPAWELEIPYKRTKLEAEQLALEAGAVVVEPDDPGWRRRQQADADGAHGRGRRHGDRSAASWAPPGSTSSTCATSPEGTRSRSSAGSPGERYLLGGVDLPLEDLFAVIARLAGRRRPRLRVPYAVAEMAGALGIVNRDEVRLARLPMFFSSEKAVSRLGYEPGPVEPALARAVAEALGKGGA